MPIYYLPNKALTFNPSSSKHCLPFGGKTFIEPFQKQDGCYPHALVMLPDHWKMNMFLF